MPPRNIAAEKQQKDRDIKEKLRIAGLKAILSDPNSQNYIWRQLEDGYIFDTTMTGNSQTFLREGKRQSALILLTDILETDPQKFIEMYSKFRRKENV